jgi:hypothetical protein
MEMDNKFLVIAVLIVMIGIGVVTAIQPTREPTVTSSNIMKVQSPQNPVVGFSTVEVINENTGETISMYIIGDE